MNNFEAWSPDKKYGVRIPAKVLNKITRRCIAAGENETGGILTGYYNKRRDCAIVTNCSVPGTDSVCKRSRFYRGIAGLQQWLLELWQRRRREFYLGEWHSHPYSQPIPSTDDTNQMVAISKDERYKCPEPILLLVGGDPRSECRCKVHVYVRSRKHVELLEEYRE